MSAEAERTAIVKWIMRYGDELNAMIARTADGPIRTSMMGEFSATVSIRHAIAAGAHLTDAAIRARASQLNEYQRHD